MKTCTLALILLCAIAAHSQTLVGGEGVPTGACTTGWANYLDYTTGARYACVNSVWEPTAYTVVTSSANPTAIPQNSTHRFVTDSEKATWSSATGIPAGLITLSLVPCPAGFSEVAALAGKTLIGTTAAAGNVGTTGGSDTISEVVNHTHDVSVNDPGHTHLTQRYPTATGGSSGFTIDTSMSGTLADNTLPTKSGTTGITAASSNPAGGVAQIDNRSAFIRVIFCSKN